MVTVDLGCVSQSCVDSVGLILLYPSLCSWNFLHDVVISCNLEI